MMPASKTLVWTAGFSILLLAFLLVGIVVAPGLVGGDDTFIVTSDSMSPTIESGDVIVTREVSPEEIESGDVVTFHDGSESNRGYVTHRVVDVVEEDGERYFQLQGDANDQPDEGLVPGENARGTLHLHVPYLGYLLLFARSDLGLFSFVILPGLVLVASGSWQLLDELGYTPDSERAPTTLFGSDETGTVDGDGDDGTADGSDPVDGGVEEESDGGEQDGSTPSDGGVEGEACR